VAQGNAREIAGVVSIWQAVEEELLVGNRHLLNEVSGMYEPAVYAWWDESGALAQYLPKDFPEVDFSMPIYVGSAPKGLELRFNEMHLKETRWSAPRRSLSPLLTDELDLLPGAVVAPKPGKFGLAADRDERLTLWMLRFLRLSHVPMNSADGAESTEEKIIEHLLPPLNDLHARAGLYCRRMRLLRQTFRGMIAEHGTSDTSP
jgi:hypothetical protein